MRTENKKLLVPDAEDSAQAAEVLQSLASDGEGPSAVKVQFRTRAGGSRSVCLPALSVKLLVEILQQTAAGNAVSVVPIRKELTTQEAAEILNVSRPFVINLIEKGEIPARKVGSHRRIPLLPLLEYKRKTAAVREEALAQMAAEAQELKLY